MHFTPSHEWICTTDDIGIVGITIYAQKELGEVVYVELPTVGRKVNKGDEVVVLESTKAAADIYTPVSGEIVEINEELKEDCRKINQSPERDGWIFKIRLQDPQELRHLMNSTQYQSLVQN